MLRRGNVFLHFKDLKLLKQEDLIFCGTAITVQIGFRLRVGVRLELGMRDQHMFECSVG